MNLPWQKWLDSLAREGRLLEIPVATRNLPWSMEMKVEGPFDQVLYPEVRLRAMPDAATVLATMTVSAATDVIEDGVPYRLWTVSLPGSGGANSVAGLPTDAAGEGVVRFPMIVIMSSSEGDAYVQGGGTFEVRGFI